MLDSSANVKAIRIWYRISDHLIQKKRLGWRSISVDLLSCHASNYFADVTPNSWENDAMDSQAVINALKNYSVPQRIRSRIVCGGDRVEEALNRVSPLQIVGGDLQAPPPKDPSVVWVVDKISNVLQRICIQIKNTPNLKRILVLATDVDEVASLMKSEPYRFLFEHPAFSIGVIDPSSVPEPDTYRSIFRPGEWDLANNTVFLYSFRPEFKGGEEWLAQIRGVFHMIIMFHREGLGSSAFTEDAFLGFKNSMMNLPKILRSPDLRNWKGLGRGKPAFLVGAGPSVKSQMEFLSSIQNDAIIIAADTMLKPLTKHGIRPHLLASIERAPEIIDLLNDPNDHPQTFLVGSAVLEPECFASYRGPSTAYLTQLPPSKWFPFSRSRMDSGHSCMGLAMGLASFLECDPIYLMGIDLCWSEEGQSHMQDVPYLQKDFYLKQNKEFYKDSFATENSQGHKVRTNLYWMAFKGQFEYWASVAPSKIFNLSPSGLPLKGVPFLNIKDVKIEHPAKNFDELLTHRRNYRRTLEIRNEVSAFIQAIDKIVEGLENLERCSPKMNCQELFQALEQTSFYFAILHPVLKADVFNLMQEDVGRADESRTLLIEYFTKMKNVFFESRQNLVTLLQEQKQERFDLF